MKISCPQCGASVQLIHTDSYLTCDFCKNSLYVDLDKTVAVFTYKSKIGPPQVGSYLKRDFAKMGFDENIQIVQSVPVFFPFWQEKDKNVLLAGSSVFPTDHIKLQSTGRLFFDTTRVDYRTEICEIDTQPQEAGERILVYCPFYKVFVGHKGKEYTYFVNAVTGEVFGDPIPFMSGKDLTPLFYLFLSIFIGFLALNYFIDGFFWGIVFNGILFLISFQLAYHIVERQMYKK